MRKTKIIEKVLRISKIRLEMTQKIFITFVLLTSMLTRCVKIPESVRFGLFRAVFSRDGSLDFSGAYVLASMLMAIQDINQSPNLMRNTSLKFALRGTNHGEYRAAAKNSQDFIDFVFGGLGVNVVVGTGYFASSKAAGQVFSYSGINNVDFGASNTELSHGDTYPFFRRVCPSDSFEGKILASLAKRHFGFNRVDLIYTLDTYGTDTSSQFISQANQLEIIIENQDSFWPGNTDFSEVLSRLKFKGIGKVYVLLMKSSDAGRFLEAGFNAGLFPYGVQILGTQYVMTPTTWRSMSENAPVAQIMNGVIGVQPYVNRSSPAFQDFLRRYLKQSDTRILNRDGSITCNSAIDDDGNTPLFTQPPATGCGGVTFSQLHSDGSDLPDTVAYAYDAVMALAHAVHQQIYVHQRYNYTGADISDSLLNDVEFEGTTGYVSLFPGLGGAEGFAIGDRQSDLYYKILNFNPNFYHKNAKTQSNAIRNIGIWTTSDRKNKSPNYDRFIACNMDDDEFCTQPVYRTIDNNPVDGSPRVMEVAMDTWAKNYLRAGASLCFATIFWYGFIVFLFWDTRLMKTSQPVVMVVVLFGGCLGSIQVILKTLVVSDNICLASMWLSHCAFAVIFLMLLFKTWRVAIIVKSGFSRIKLTSNRMYQIVSCCFFGFCLILLIDTLVGKPQRVNEESFNGYQIIRYVRCKSKNPNITRALFVIEAMILFYGAKMSYDAKDAPKSVNDSTFVSLAIYLILFVCSVTFPIVFLSIDPTPQNLDLVMASGFIIAVVGVLNILFAHRTFLVLDGVDVDQNFNLVRSKQSSSSSKDRLSNMAGRLSERFLSKVGKSSVVREENNESAISSKKATLSKMPSARDLNKMNSSKDLFARGNSSKPLIKQNSGKDLIRTNSAKDLGLMNNEPSKGMEGEPMEATQEITDPEVRAKINNGRSMVSIHDYSDVPESKTSQ